MPSLNLSMFVLALMHSLAAAAPGYHYSYPINNSTASWYPTGTGTTPVQQSATASITKTVSPTTVSLPYYPSSTITTVVTKTKTLTWTLYIPCTTSVHGTTSYYSTASIYTTCVPEYETVTLTKSCGPSCYGTEPTTTSIYVLPTVTPPTVPATVVPATVGPKSSTTIVVPVYASIVVPVYSSILTCPPAPTVTVSSIHTVTVESPKTVTVIESYVYKTITVTAAPSATTTSGSAEHGMCRPGTPCYSNIHSHGSWNTTMVVTSATHHGTGTALPSGTAY